MIFFHNVDGKELKYPFNQKEFEQYKTVCLTIWGALPYDVGWAMSTNIFKNGLQSISSQS
jgi:hypothetical protein